MLKEAVKDDIENDMSLREAAIKYRNFPNHSKNIHNIGKTVSKFYSNQEEHDYNTGRLDLIACFCSSNNMFLLV